MTKEYQDFIEKTKEFLSNDTISASDYCEYVDQFWFEHEEDLEYAQDQNEYNDENTIVSDIWGIADRYDSCDDIVKHDPYCINSLQLKELIKKRLKQIQ